MNRWLIIGVFMALLAMPIRAEDTFLSVKQKNLYSDWLNAENNKNLFIGQANISCSSVYGSITDLCTFNETNITLTMGDYVLKTGDNMTGNLYMNNVSNIVFGSDLLSSGGIEMIDYDGNDAMTIAPSSIAIGNTISQVGSLWVYGTSLGLSVTNMSSYDASISYAVFGPTNFIDITTDNIPYGGSNNYWWRFGVGSTGELQISTPGGNAPKAFSPAASNQYNLGNNSRKWKTLYVTNVSSTDIQTTTLNASSNISTNKLILQTSGGTSSMYFRSSTGVNNIFASYVEGTNATLMGSTILASNTIQGNPLVLKSGATKLVNVYDSIYFRLGFNTSELPACDSDHLGFMEISDNGESSGTPTVIRSCLRKSDDLYEWNSMTFADGIIGSASSPFDKIYVSNIEIENNTQFNGSVNFLNNTMFKLPLNDYYTSTNYSIYFNETSKTCNDTFDSTGCNSTTLNDASNISWNGTMDLGCNGTQVYTNSNYEHVEEVYSNATAVRPNNPVNITCQFREVNRSSSGDYRHSEYIFYYDGNSWYQLYYNWTNSSDVGSYLNGASVNRSIVFNTNSTEGKHTVRCNINYRYNTSNFCNNASSNNHDTDDINFTVVNNDTGWYNYTLTTNTLPSCDSALRGNMLREEDDTEGDKLYICEYNSTDYGWREI